MENGTNNAKTNDSKAPEHGSAKQFSGDSYLNKIVEQEYDKLKQDCLSKKVLFEDPLFPAKNLSFLHNIDSKKVKWLRPSEICENPLFVVDGAHRQDITQGRINDCWFMSALSSVTSQTGLLQKIVPFQSFDNYAGIFHFNIYLFDSWIPIVVDDLLPTYNGELVLAHSFDKNEFWVALLEKAYAKLKGSYEVLSYGHATEALFDLTGGITEYYKFSSKDDFPPRFFNVLFQSFLRKSLICCYIGTSKSKNKEERLKCGLITHHCYSIINIARLHYNGHQTYLICLKNPWNKEVTWQGAWSDLSKEWNSVSDETKNSIGYSISPDSGEFWIAYDDLIKYYNVFEFCHLNNPSNPSKYNWNPIQFIGKWIKNENAGGCVNNKDTFMKNPKYLLTLVDVDVEDDQDVCTVIISLMQKNFRYRKHIEEKDIQIGFVLYHYGELDQQANQSKIATAVELGPDDVDKNYFRNNTSIGRVDYICKKQVSCRYRLKSGRYLIIPTTFNKNEEATYMLRIYTSRSEENKGDFDSHHVIHNVNT